MSLFSLIQNHQLLKFCKDDQVYMITTMSKIKSRFKRFFSEIYTVSLCKKIIDSEVESKSDAELRVSEEMR